MNSVSQESPTQEIESVFQLQQAYAPIAARTTARERIQKLKKIYNYLVENEKEALAALKNDLGKPEVEALAAEIGVVLGNVKDISSKLKGWMADKKVVTPLLFTGSSSYIRHEAKGVALIISPWNYPLQLSLNPLLYAIAAGCTAVIKPSEYSVHTTAFVKKLVDTLFDKKEVVVFTGGVPTSQSLLALPFNHMFFTGSPQVGKIVMKSAAQHLASITLELGGKSPCIIDESAPIDKLAKRLVWGKYYNVGQTCIAPDYVLVHKSKVGKLETALKKNIARLYDEGNGIKASSGYGRIISEKHFDMLSGLLDNALSNGAELVTGGEKDRSQKYFAPTVIRNVSLDSDIMQNEIFGPILPIIPYENIDEALKIIADRPKPLAMYILSNRNRFIKDMLRKTTAGGTVVNDFLIHFANHNLPSGGVNNSGIGKTHGIHGFMAFTNERAVMRNRFLPTSLFYPPYTKMTRRLAALIGKWI